ncbi:MAG: PaaI family thioesterase [Succiniclasticum sp.]
MEVLEKQKERYPKDPVIPTRVARDPKTGYYLDCAARIREVYAHNWFMNNCFSVYLEEIHCGHCVVSMKTDPDLHTEDGVHIGADFLAALGDTVLGVTGASMGERVVTVMSSLNFVRGAVAGTRLYVRSKVAHHGRTTMDIESRITDEDGTLLATMLSVMMNVGKFEGIPAEW